MKPTPAFRTLQHKLRRLTQCPTAHVHEVRIIMKILRAGLKLYDRNSPQLRQSRRQLRSLGRDMAALREVESRNELLHWLRQHDVRVPANLTVPKTTASKSVRQRVKQAAKDSLVITNELVTTMQTTTSQQIKQQCKRSSKRLQRAAQLAKKLPSLANLHELRKRVKDLYYQLQYFMPQQGNSQQRQQRYLQRAGHQLGITRDLMLLAQNLVTAPPTDSTLKFLTKIESLALKYQRCSMKTSSKSIL